MISEPPSSKMRFCARSGDIPLEKASIREIIYVYIRRRFDRDCRVGHQKKKKKKDKRQTRGVYIYKVSAQLSFSEVGRQAKNGRVNYN